MGKSNAIIKQFYDLNDIGPSGCTALLGFTNNNWYAGDCYDIQLGNWDINGEWNLKQQYDTIICIRTALFAKNAEELVLNCAKWLKPGGTLFIDWGIGGHLYNSTKSFVIGGKVENNKQEVEYVNGFKSTMLSCLWDDSFENNAEVEIFKKNIEKFGYSGPIKQHLEKEMDSFSTLDNISKIFTTKINFITLWPDNPQLYILLTGTLK